MMEFESEYPCVLCNKTFARFCKLQSHMTTHEEVEAHEDDTEVEVRVKKEDDEDYMPEWEELERHSSHNSRNVYMEDKPDMPSSEGHDEPAPVEFQSTKRRKFKSSSFFRLRFLKHDEGIHMPRNFKVKDSKYECTVCHKKFRYQTYLKIHTRIHTGLKPHICGICYKGFTQSSSLTSHMRIHTGEKPYHCPLCPKSFKESSKVTRHMRVHTGERPYMCRLCGKGFSQSGSVKIHQAIHYRKLSEDQPDKRKKKQKVKKQVKRLANKSRAILIQKIKEEPDEKDTIEVNNGNDETIISSKATEKKQVGKSVKKKIVKYTKKEQYKPHDPSQTVGRNVRSSRVTNKKIYNWRMFLSNTSFISDNVMKNGEMVKTEDLDKNDDEAQPLVYNDECNYDAPVNKNNDVIQDRKQKKKAHRELKRNGRAVRVVKQNCKEFQVENNVIKKSRLVSLNRKIKQSKRFKKRKSKFNEHKGQTSKIEERPKQESKIEEQKGQVSKVEKSKRQTCQQGEEVKDHVSKGEEGKGKTSKVEECKGQNSKVENHKIQLSIDSGHKYAVTGVKQHKSNVGKNNDQTTLKEKRHTENEQGNVHRAVMLSNNWNASLELQEPGTSAEEPKSFFQCQNVMTATGHESPLRRSKRIAKVSSKLNNTYVMTRTWTKIGNGCKRRQDESTKRLGTRWVMEKLNQVTCIFNKGPARKGVRTVASRTLGAVNIAMAASGNTGARPYQIPARCDEVFSHGDPTSVELLNKPDDQMSVDHPQCKGGVARTLVKDIFPTGPMPSKDLTLSTNVINNGGPNSNNWDNNIISTKHNASCDSGTYPKDGDVTGGVMNLCKHGSSHNQSLLNSNNKNCYVNFDGQNSTIYSNNGDYSVFVDNNNRPCRDGVPSSVHRGSHQNESRVYPSEIVSQNTNGTFNNNSVSFNEYINTSHGGTSSINGGSNFDGTFINEGNNYLFTNHRTPNSNVTFNNNNTNFNLGTSFLNNSPSNANAGDPFLNNTGTNVVTSFSNSNASNYLNNSHYLDNGVPHHNGQPYNHNSNFHNEQIPSILQYSISILERNRGFLGPILYPPQGLPVYQCENMIMQYRSTGGVDMAQYGRESSLEAVQPSPVNSLRASNTMFPPSNVVSSPMPTSSNNASSPIQQQGTLLLSNNQHLIQTGNTSCLERENCQWLECPCKGCSSNRVMTPVMSPHHIDHPPYVVSPGNNHQSPGSFNGNPGTSSFTNNSTHDQRQTAADPIQHHHFPQVNMYGAQMNP